MNPKRAAYDIDIGQAWSHDGVEYIVHKIDRDAMTATLVAGDHIKEMALGMAIAPIDGKWTQVSYSEPQE